jgi:hypothetical protein
VKVQVLQPSTPLRHAAELLALINISTFEGCTKFQRSIKKIVQTLVCGAQLRQLL